MPTVTGHKVEDEVESSGEATDRKLRGLSSGTGKVYRQYSGKGYKEPLCSTQPRLSSGNPPSHSSSSWLTV